MRCQHCGHRYPVNIQLDYGPGGQESPGLFFVIGAIFLVAGVILHITIDTFWTWFCYGIAGFVWLQCGVAWTDCRRVTCPRCDQPARVRPWSF
jgi:hypothetical protein